MIKERFSYVDLGAGIMIIWMVLGHTFMAAGFTGTPARPSGITDYVPNFLFYFMPWFFYKSGQFFHIRNVNEELNKDWNKLMKPYLIWSAIGFASYLISLVVYGSFSFRSAVYLPVRHLILGGVIDLNQPLWFLFTLFGVKQVANIILPKEKDKYYWLKCVIIILMGFSLSFGLYCLNCRFIPGWMANGSAGLAFFSLGYCLNRYETKWWLLVPCILGYIACCIWGFPDVGMRSNSCETPIKYLLNIPASIAGIVAFNVMCRSISKNLHYISLPFEYVGKYAMIIYVSHGIIYGSISWLLDSMYHSVTYACVFWVIFCSYIVFIPLLCYLSNKAHSRN